MKLTTVIRDIGDGENSYYRFQAANKAHEKQALRRVAQLLQGDEHRVLGDGEVLLVPNFSTNK